MGPVQVPVRLGRTDEVVMPGGDAAVPDGADAVHPQTSTAMITTRSASTVFIYGTVHRQT